jgi:hypothetical protein
MRDSYTNPSKTKRIEYFGIFDLTKRIHETNLWKTGLRNESTIRIFGKPAYETNPQYESLRFGFASPPAWICKDSFCAIVLRIRKDSRGFVGFVKTGRIFGKSVYETNPRNESFENIKDSWFTIRNESGFVNHETNLFGVRIRDYDTKRIHGFAKRILVFTNLLYDSRILRNFT